MAFRLSARSLKALEGVHPDLVRVVHRAITLTNVDFLVTEGVRTPERQKELYSQGRSKPGKKVTWTLISNHFKKADGYGHAVDLCPFPVDWNDSKKFAEIAKAMKDAARIEKVPVVWGGDWRSNRDSPHFELATRTAPL